MRRRPAARSAKLAGPRSARASGRRNGRISAPLAVGPSLRALQRSTGRGPAREWPRRTLGATGSPISASAAIRWRAAGSASSQASISRRCAPSSSPSRYATRRSSLRCCILGTPTPLAPGLELQLQRDTGPCETAHDRADRDLHHFRGLLVAEPLDGNEQQGRSLIRRQAIKRLPNLGESKTCFDPTYRLIRSQPVPRRYRHSPCARPANGPDRSRSSARYGTSSCRTACPPETGAGAREPARRRPGPDRRHRRRNPKVRAQNDATSARRRSTDRRTGRSPGLCPKPSVPAIPPILDEMTTYLLSIYSRQCFATNNGQHLIHRFPSRTAVPHSSGRSRRGPRRVYHRR